MIRPLVLAEATLAATTLCPRITSLLAEAEHGEKPKAAARIADARRLAQQLLNAIATAETATGARS